MAEEKLTATLERFGLTSQEAGLFVFLSQVRRSGSNWATAPELSKAIAKNRVRTYQILRRLQEIGLVESRYGRPKKYSAVTSQTAIRRLMALQETRLTELSHLEREVVDSLLNLPPVTIRHTTSEEADAEQSGTTLIQGIPNIQATLRRILEDQDILLVTNDDSYEHLINVIKYLAKRPRTLRIISGSSKRRRRLLYSTLADKSYLQAYSADLPTLILTGKHFALPFYSLESYKRRPLSKPVTRTRISDLVVVDDSRFVRQMNQLFKLLRTRISATPSQL